MLDAIERTIATILASLNIKDFVQGTGEEPGLERAGSNCV